ncbi:MAG: DUF72 domain-containing protein [Methanoculleus bourgensis]|jgi:uncharacterized protein YecE (DUF72 family)|uniref:DUF72 domain-containing protein n=1 Tax=Methanoculleus TaxID=45989 RepID=UPI0007BCB993|nr:DUF72 domain-containing protein [Methanoculleus sp. UBA413]MDD3373697.1 DUF72 domain-containing protein [Methanoculleus bourgensis]NMA88224.1 DUF72 domain-containing protein [Methanoculleus bourgensis]SAI89400.1 hypothetical protein MBBA_2560 [Methanoculleus bourgensis]
MEVHVGTSGWAYAWNRGGSLAWFAEHSGLDAIELNASFYGFPSEKSVLSWADAGSGLRWSIKVNRSVTHRHRFNEKAVAVWERFRERFLPLDDLVDFYLFQAPPAFGDVNRILAFAGATGLGDRCAVEIRNPGVLGDDETCRRLQEAVVLVSVDSPDFRERVFPAGVVYLRVHGREDWYRHDYTDAELAGIRDRIAAISPERAYIFFNNNHAMLKNARAMMRLFEQGPAG